MNRMWLVIAVSMLAGSSALAADTKPAAAAGAKPEMAAPPAPVLPPEGKRWVEGHVGKWVSTDASMAMGDMKMTGKMTMNCEKASSGWASVCKGKFESKGMPAQEMTMLMGWDMQGGMAHMFEVANTGEVHDHTGKWTDDKNISMVRDGKNVEGKDETDTLNFAWTSPKELKVSGDGKQAGVVAWSFTSTMKKQ